MPVSVYNAYTFRCGNIQHVDSFVCLYCQVYLDEHGTTDRETRNSVVANRSRSMTICLA